jgi:hypothetical protein
MSYAIETKKRKWDRLLESFNDRSVSRPTTATPQNTSSTSLIPTFEEELAKKRRLETSSALSLAKNASNASLISNYLPSNRAAFLERLETFRPVTKWHIPSTESINAAEWAKRGWICVDTDIVACGICRERVYVNIDLEDDINKENEEQDSSEPDTSRVVEDDDSYSAAVEVYENIVKKFAEIIVTAHAEGCQWKRRGCDPSIQRVEGLLNSTNVITSLRNRYDGLSSNAAKVPETQLLSKRGEDAEKEIRRFQFEENTRPDINALRLAICGWRTRSEDVFECRNCFRSLGLWLYRGEQPAMEKLDAIESHLEYCPWRSSAAQQTEIAGPARDEDGSQAGMQQMAGWQLVCQAMKLDNAKRRRKTLQDDGSRPASAVSGDLSSTDTGVDVALSPEQREKKMKALLERIKSVKTPFNVKALLKKKKEAKTG